MPVSARRGTRATRAWSLRRSRPLGGGRRECRPPRRAEMALGHTRTVLAPHPARHLLRAKDLVDARYREPLDVKTLARAAKLSPAHFSREFRREFGESPHQYLLMRRLERAAVAPPHHRSLGRGHLPHRRAAQRRLVHDELPPHVRHDADGVPRRSSAGHARVRIPTCVQLAWARPETARLEKTAG